MKRNVLASVLIISILSTCIAGCGNNSANDEMKSNIHGTYVKPGETVSSDSKWINSAIEGSVDESVNVRLQDDFYTAVNKEWDLSFELEENEYASDAFEDDMKLVTERKLQIISGEDSEIDLSNWSSDKSVGLTADMVVHNRELVSRFAELAGNWDDRNAKGVEPMRPFVEKILNINSIEEMTEYLSDSKNIVSNQFPLVTIRVGTYEKDKENYNIIVADETPDLSLGNARNYFELDIKSSALLDATNEKVRYILGRLGYTDKQINSILRNSYDLECKIAGSIYPDSGKKYEEFTNAYDNDYSVIDIAKLEGDYPLTTLLANRGLDKAERIKIYNTDTIKTVAKLYTKKNLELFKSYYIVHFVSNNIDLLDREAYEKNNQIHKDYSLDTLDATASEDVLPMPNNVENMDSMSEEEKETALLFNDYINKYMCEPMEIVYIAKYATPEMKENLKELIDDIRSIYKVMLVNNPNRDATSIELAVKKLDNMAVRVLYPDEFTDFSTLEFEDGDDYSLIEAVAAITAFELDKDNKKVGKKVDRHEWDLAEMPTTSVAAYNRRDDNSINICEGILATDFLYDLNAEDEVNMGRLGMVVAHEISHSFDHTGLMFDENGNMSKDFDLSGTIDDTKSIINISRYFNSVMPYPGAATYHGSEVVDEALADMGGVKCMLTKAINMPNFDYDLFFRSYAQLWRQKAAYLVIYETASQDVHPLNFMRTNMVLQQYDEFIKTYDIKQGDGMYLDPKDRVVYW